MNIAGVVVDSVEVIMETVVVGSGEMLFIATVVGSVEVIMAFVVNSVEAV